LAHGYPPLLLAWFRLAGRPFGCGAGGGDAGALSMASAVASLGTVKFWFCGPGEGPGGLASLRAGVLLPCDSASEVAALPARLLRLREFPILAEMLETKGRVDCCLDRGPEVQGPLTRRPFVF
jgi:hypothetical protein